MRPAGLVTLPWPGLGMSRACRALENWPSRNRDSASGLVQLRHFCQVSNTPPLPANAPAESRSEVAQVAMLTVAAQPCMPAQLAAHDRR